MYQDNRAYRRQIMVNPLTASSSTAAGSGTYSYSTAVVKVESQVSVDSPGCT